MFYVAFLYNERMVQIKSKVAKVTPNLKLCTTQVFFRRNLWFWWKSSSGYASKCLLLGSRMMQLRKLAMIFTNAIEEEHCNRFGASLFALCYFVLVATNWGNQHKYLPTHLLIASTPTKHNWNLKMQTLFKMAFLNQIKSRDVKCGLFCHRKSNQHAWNSTPPWCGKYVLTEQHLHFYKAHENRALKNTYLNVFRYKYTM